jgi:hypothetical protein
MLALAFSLPWPSLAQADLFPAANTSTAQVRFASEEFNFGRVWTGDRVEAEFRFTNPGAQTLEIAEVKPGCSCTQAGPFDRFVLPGKSGRVILRLDTTGMSGPVRRQTLVTTKNAIPTKVMLLLNGEVAPLAEVEPREIIFGRLESGQLPVSRTVRVTSRLSEPLRILSCASTVPEFKATCQEKKAGSVFEVTVATNARLAPGAYTGMLRLQLASPSSRTIAIPLSAWVQNALDIQPRELSVPVGPLKKELVRTLTLSAKNSPLPAVADLRSNLAEVQIDCPGNTYPSNRQTLTVIFKRGAYLKPPGPWWVEVATSDPNTTPLRVPVVPETGETAASQSRP